MSRLPPEPPEGADPLARFRTAKLYRATYRQAWRLRWLLVNGAASRLPPRLRARYEAAQLDASPLARHKGIGLTVVVALALDLLFDAIEATDAERGES